METEEAAPSYAAIADMLPAKLHGGEICPLCGKTGMHEHTATEIVIYRNGVKYGRSLTPPDQAQPHVKTAAELRADAAHDMSCVGAFARARP